MRLSWFKKNLANFFTLISLFWGFSSILASIQTINELYQSVIFNRDSSTANPEIFLGFAGLCIIFATFFDFLDGLTARILKVQSKLGKQLDSLSDLVSFGIAPGVLFHTITLIAGDYIPGTGIYYSTKGFIANLLLPNLFILKILAFAFPVCAIIRLAQFNVKKEKDYFEGIPSTYAGGLAALVLTFNFYLTPLNWLYGKLFGGELPIILTFLVEPLKVLFSNYFFIVFIYLGLSFLMISKFRFYKLKSFLINFFSKKYIFLVFILISSLILFFKYIAVLMCFAYLFISLVQNIFLKKPKPLKR